MDGCVSAILWVNVTRVSHRDVSVQMPDGSHMARVVLGNGITGMAFEKTRGEAEVAAEKDATDRLAK